MLSLCKSVSVITGLTIASVFLPIAAAAQSQSVAAAHSDATQFNASESNAARPKESAGPDLTKQPTLYVVGYAHLDTQWRWEYPTTINEYILKTMRLNFDLFERYPHYIFNFSGANRYRMMKEYFPADYQKVKKYVAAGHWFPAGSSMEEGDAIYHPAESLIWDCLYGIQFLLR